jgi:hypothetical protein
MKLASLALAFPLLVAAGWGSAAALRWFRTHRAESAWLALSLFFERAFVRFQERAGDWLDDVSQPGGTAGNGSDGSGWDHGDHCDHCNDGGCDSGSGGCDGGGD